MTKLVSLGMVLMLMVAAGCATSPTGRSQLALLPEDQLQKMGDEAFAKMRKDGKLVEDRRTQAYVECVAGKITGALGSRQTWQVAASSAWTWAAHSPIW